MEFVNRKKKHFFVFLFYFFFCFLFFFVSISFQKNKNKKKRSAALRTVFLKHKNVMKGRYFAEITAKVFERAQVFFFSFLSFVLSLSHSLARFSLSLPLFFFFCSCVGATYHPPLCFYRFIMQKPVPSEKRDKF